MKVLFKVASLKHLNIKNVGYNTLLTCVHSSVNGCLCPDVLMPLARNKILSKTEKCLLLFIAPILSQVFYTFFFLPACQLMFSSSTMKRHHKY